MGNAPDNSTDASSNVDFERWIRKPFWQLAEAVQLVLGQEPDPGSTLGTNLLDKTDPQKLLYTQAIDAVYMGELIVHLGWIGQYYWIRLIDPRIAAWAFDPAEFVRWAAWKVQRLPDRLLDFGFERFGSRAPRRRPRFTWPKYPPPANPACYADRVSTTEDPPNYPAWYARRSWSPPEIVFLLHGEAPPPRDEESGKWLEELPLSDSRRHLYRTLVSEVLRGKLVPIDGLHPHSRTMPVGTAVNGGSPRWHFSPEDVLAWARPHVQDIDAKFPASGVRRAPIAREQAPPSPSEPAPTSGRRLSLRFSDERGIGVAFYNDVAIGIMRDSDFPYLLRLALERRTRPEHWCSAEELGCGSAPISRIRRGVQVIEPDLDLIATLRRVGWRLSLSPAEIRVEVDALDADRRPDVRQVMKRHVGAG